MNRRQIRQSGFSLVELLIAMSLGLILIAGMIAVFSGNKRTSELTAEMANMQESARFALQQMSTDLRSAGFQGCLALDHGTLVDLTESEVVGNRGIYLTAVTGSIVVDANTWQPDAIDEYIPPANIQAIPGTHTLAMRGGTEDRVRLRTPMVDGGGRPSPGANLVLQQFEQFNAGVGDTVIISDCEYANLFTISDRAMLDSSVVLAHAINSSLTGLAVNTSPNLDQPYGYSRTNNGGINIKLSQVTVTPFFSKIYFVGTTGELTENGDRITSLYQQTYPFDSMNNPPTELIQGIENMRVSFGIQDGNGLVQYVQANDPMYDPSAVVSVQVGLLMTSWDQIATIDDNNTYVLAGQPIQAATSSNDGFTHVEDARFRLAFNTTIKIRNRRVPKQ